MKFESFDEDVRDILRARGLGWLPLSHLNSHGHNKEVKADNVTSLFRDVPPALTRWLATIKISETVRKIKFFFRNIIDKYELDFELCGYEETLRIMRRDLLNS